MDMKNKTCLFCLKQRQILVDNPNTANAIKDIYSINLPKDECRICVECHFNILRVKEFKRTIEAAADFDVDSCFVCKSENTVNEPGVDRIVDYLIKQCTTIDFGNTDTFKSCVTCMHVLEISIKYEKLATNYASAKRFCKQYSTLKECNVVLQKVDLNALGQICEGFNDGDEKRPEPKKSRKRGRSSIGGEDVTPKKNKQEDGSVLPVMLTKLTPTGGKKSSPPSLSKGKPLKQSDKIFIKLPLFTKQKKKLHHRRKFGAPHSPSKSIPASPSVNDLNRIFSVQLRPLKIRIEHIDLSTYLNKTISHDKANRQQRKPRNEEFIGLDEEDVVELQNTTFNSSISKRKSILITERTESPNSAKKKVKFSDSPSIKYVDKLDFSDDENGTKSSDGDDEDYEVIKSKKKTLKPSNGTSPATPENGKPRIRGRPKRVRKDENSEDNRVSVKSSRTATALGDTGSPSEKDEDIFIVIEDVEISDHEKDKDEEKTEQTSTDDNEKPTEEIKSNQVPVENGDAEEQKTESPVQPPVVDDNQAPPPDVSNAPPMDAEDADNTEPMRTDQIEDAPADAEMKPVDSPDDVEMIESKSPPAEDVEMQEMDSTAVELVNDLEPTPSLELPVESLLQDNSAPVPEELPNLSEEQQSAVDFETFDKQEEEMATFELKLSSFLGKEVSDSEQDASQQSHGDKTLNSVEENQHDTSETAEDFQEEHLELNLEAQTTPPAETTTTTSLAETTTIPATESPSNENQCFSSLDDVDDISDDDDILDQLDEPTGLRNRSPDLPPLGEDSL